LPTTGIFNGEGGKFLFRAELKKNHLVTKIKRRQAREYGCNIIA
jgi:hypothetical protein